jgi:hypothetical protein
MWKGCPCFTTGYGSDLIDYVEPTEPNIYWVEVAGNSTELQEVLAWIASNEKMTLDSALPSPPIEQALCQPQDIRGYNLDAPQRDSDSIDGTPSVTNSTTDFCNKFNGVELKVASEGIDTQFTMIKKPFGSYFVSASIKDNPPGANCGNTAQINKIDCLNSFWAGMLRCDPDSGLTHGFFQPDHCINYVSLTTLLGDFG